MTTSISRACMRPVDPSLSKEIIEKIIAPNTDPRKILQELEIRKIQPTDVAGREFFLSELICSMIQSIQLFLERKIQTGEWKLSSQISARALFQSEITARIAQFKQDFFPPSPVSCSAGCIVC